MCLPLDTAEFEALGEPQDEAEAKEPDARGEAGTRPE
jgi:hypothetical protein